MREPFNNRNQRSLRTDKREIERLVKRAQDGDEDAFSALYDCFVQPLYRYVYFRCNGADVEDLLTTIFMKVWMNLKKYRMSETTATQSGLPSDNQPGTVKKTAQGNGIASFSAWAFRIAHNVVVDFYRASHANRHPEELSDSHEDPKRENRASHGMEQALNREVLKQAIPKLKEPYQQIILLKFINEFSNGEVAEVLGRSENSLRILQFRALRKLRKILQEMGVTEV